jgi:phi13 family phage major tail protein
MATLGFKKATVGILDDTEKTVQLYEFSAAEGGTINAKISGLGSTLSTVYASNAPFYISGQGVSSPKLDLQIADIPEATLNAILGVSVGLDGIAKITSSTKAPYIAVLLETQGKDGDQIFIGLTKGKMAYPDVELKTGEDKGLELATDSISGDFVSRADEIVYLKGRTGTTEFTEAAFRALLFKDYVETP